MLERMMLPLAQNASSYNWHPVVNSIVFGLIGIVMVVLGYKVFDWATPKLDVERELAQNKNLAVAIVAGAMILGIAWIVAAAIG